MIYDDMKDDNWELERDNKKMVANIDKCIADGGNLYVSCVCVHLKITFVQGCFQEENYQLAERNEMYWCKLRKTNLIDESETMLWDGDNPAYDPNMTPEEERQLREKGLLDEYKMDD